MKYLPALADGVLVTLTLSGVAWCSGIFLGSLLGFLCIHSVGIKKIFSILSFLLVSLPVLVLLFWAHYPLQEMLGVNVSPVLTSIIVFSLVNTFLVAQIIIKSEEQLPDEYVYAAYFSGMTKIRVFLKIQLPLILRASASNIISTQVVVLHMTLFSSLISVDDLFRTAQRINSIEYQPVEIYTLVALFYIFLSMPLLFLSKLVKNPAELNSLKGE